MKLACESTVILVILSVSDAIRDLTSFSYPLQTAFPCSLSSMALFQNSCQNLALVGWCFFFGGGRWGGGGGGLAAGGGVSLGGGGRASCVLFLMFFYVY